MRSNGLKLTVFSLTVCAAIVATAWAQTSESERPVRSTSRLSTGEERASSVPSDERDLGFSQPGLIAEVNVKDGDVIKKGQLLATQDTSVEEAALAREEFLLKSGVQKLAAEAQLGLAEVKLKRAEKLFNEDAGSILELEEARLEVTVSKLKVELANEETESKRLEIVRLQKQIEHMRIVSEFDGEIRKVEIAVGEVADPQKPSIIAVSNQPLHVTTNIVTSIANTLEVGQTLQVRYLDEQTWREATIKSFDPVANATSGKQLIRLEMPNPERRRSGQEMAVKLPTNVASAKK